MNDEADVTGCWGCWGRRESSEEAVGDGWEGRRATWPPVVCGSVHGTYRVNVLPRPSSLSAVMSPPSSAPTSRAIDSPSPVPP